MKYSAYSTHIGEDGVGPQGAFLRDQSPTNASKPNDFASMRGSMMKSGVGADQM